MKLSNLKNTWETLGSKDPLWAVLTDDTKKNNKWDTKDFFQTGVNDVSEIMKMQNKLFKNINYGNALDFGCGVGRLTQALCEYYVNVTGVDISSSMVDYATRYNKYTHRCSYIVNTKPDLSIYEDQTFDAIYTFIVLQHMELRYSTAYIKEFLRILKPGGILVFQIPDSWIKNDVLNYLKRYIVCKYKEIKKVPYMEIHCIKNNDVYDLIEHNGGILVYMEKNYDAGPFNISYTYWVQKR